jgi:hypothetical protein
LPNWENVKRISRRFGGESFDEPTFKMWAGLAEAKKQAA